MEVGKLYVVVVTVVVHGGRRAGPLWQLSSYHGGPPLSWPIVVVCAGCGVVWVWCCRRLRRLVIIFHCFRLRVVVFHRRYCASWSQLVICCRPWRQPSNCRDTSLSVVMAVVVHWGGLCFVLAYHGCGQ